MNSEEARPKVERGLHYYDSFDWIDGIFLNHVLLEGTERLHEVVAQAPTSGPKDLYI